MGDGVITTLSSGVIITLSFNSSSFEGYDVQSFKKPLLQEMAVVATCFPSTHQYQNVSEF